MLRSVKFSISFYRLTDVCKTLFKLFRKTSWTDKNFYDYEEIKISFALIKHIHFCFFFLVTTQNTLEVSAFVYFRGIYAQCWRYYALTAGGLHDIKILYLQQKLIVLGFGLTCNVQCIIYNGVPFIKIFRREKETLEQISFYFLGY